MKFSNKSNQGSVMIESLAYFVAFTTLLLLIEPCLRSDAISSQVSAAQIIKRRRLPNQPGYEDDGSHAFGLEDHEQYEDHHYPGSSEQSLISPESEGARVAAVDGVQNAPQRAVDNQSNEGFQFMPFMVYFLLGGAFLTTLLGSIFFKTSEWGFSLGIATTVLLLVLFAHLFDYFNRKEGSWKKTKIGLGISMATVGILGPSITLAATGEKVLGITWGWAPMGYVFSVAVTAILLAVIWYRFYKDYKSDLSPNVASSVLGTLVVLTSGIGAISFTTAASGLDGWAMCFITIGVLSSALTIWISSIVISNQSKMTKCAKGLHYTFAAMTAVGVGGALASGLLKVNGNLTEHALFNADSCPVLEVVFPVFAAMGGGFAILWMVFALRKHIMMACKCKKLTKDNEPAEIN